MEHLNVKATVHLSTNTSAKEFIINLHEYTRGETWLPEQIENRLEYETNIELVYQTHSLLTIELAEGGTIGELVVYTDSGTLFNIEDFESNLTRTLKNTLTESFTLDLDIQGNTSNYYLPK